MTTPPHDPREPGEPGDDVTLVPGLGPTGGLPTPRQETPPTHLDPAMDPDRYDPARDAAPPPGGLDPAQDPDRYDAARDVPPGQGQTLPDLLGAGAHEEPRDNYQWAIGLLGVLAFLALVSFFFASVVSP